MRILFIDDLRQPQFECVIARTPEDAQSKLMTSDWDEVWFDHDMGGADNPFSRDIRNVVKYLATRAFFGEPIKIGKVIIHTQNPVGAQWIEFVLSPYYKVVRIIPHATEIVKTISRDGTLFQGE